jgi:hypothetical protein
MCVVSRLLVVPRFVMLCSFTMVTGGVGIVLGRVSVMLSRFFDMVSFLNNSKKVSASP